MALAGRNYFDSLSGERQNQYREIYNKQRSLGMPSIEAMDYAQKNIMSIEGVKAPETVPSVNPAKTMMANTTGRKSFLTGQDVQNYFGVNRQDNLATEQDKAAAKWQPSKLNGRKYFDTLTDPDQVTLYQNTYNQARNNGMSSDDAMMKAQQATEGAFAQKANEGYRNILIGDKDARDDIQQLFGVDKFNQMDIPDQDIVLNAWEAGGIDSMIEAINSNGLNKKYNINVGWNPSANAFSFAPAPGEEEPFSLETGEQITPYDTTQQKFNNKRQELEAELSRLFKEDEQNLVELYLNADGELDTAWYDSEEEINKAYQKFVNNQRRQEIEKELEALDNQYKLERQQGLVNRTENEEKREELRPQLDDITEQLGALKAQYADARLRDDQEALSRLAEQIAELEEKEAPLEREYNDLDVTLKQANSALNATVNAFGEFGNAVVQGVETLAANLLDTARGHMGDPASIRDDSLAKREMEQIVNAWRAMRLSEEEIADRTEKLWTMTEQAAVGNREMVDDWSKSLHDEIVNRAAIVGNYGQAVKEAVMDFAAAPWKDGQFEKYNDTKKIEAVVDFINENVVAATGIQMGQQLPSLLFNLFSGGAGAGAGLLEQTLLSPDFWMIFVGEYCGEYAEKYNNGEQITGTDEALMVFSSLINAGIELYDADGGPSGVEGYYAGVKNLAQSVGGEIWEELRQGTVTKVSEDLADLLQGRELRHPLYSADMSDSAIINIQEMIETTWRTALTTLGMDAVRASALAPIGRALGKQATNQDLNEDEKALIEQGKNIMSQLEQEAEQHQAFEQSVNGEDPETARDKPMPAREVARDIENNEGTTNEQTISSEPGQELPEQGRQPAETRPADQRKTYSEMTLEEMQAEKERQEENPEGFRPDRKQALDAAIRTAEARAKITAQTPEEYRRTLREQTRDIENNEDTTNPNNIQVTYKVEEQGLPDVPRPQRETAPEQQELTAQRPEGEQLQNEEALNEEQKAEQEAIAEEDEGTAENPENYIPQEGRDVPPPQGETLTDEQGMPRTNEAATAENEAAEAEQVVVPGEGQAAEATESIVQNPEEPAAPETTPAEENNEVEPQSKEGNYEEEPTDEGELPHANTKIEQETEAEAKRSGFKAGRTNGDGRYDTGVHLVSTGGNISENKTKVLQIIDRFAKHFGFSVEAYNGDPVENGFYRQGGRIVSINLNTENPFQTVLSHEAFHMVKSLSPKSAQQIEAIFDRYAAGAGFDVDHEIDLIIAQYASAGKLDSLGATDAERRAGAKEELIANSMYSLLSDEQTMRRIYAEDRNLFQRIMDWVSKAQQSIQEMLNDYADNTPEARMLRDQQGALEELHKAMLDALEEMKALDDAKKAAAPVHGNGEMTREYQRQVKNATNNREITEAARSLAEAVLKKTRNEVTQDNVTRLMYAAQEVQAGSLPAYALINNGLSRDSIVDPETRRAMIMLSGYMNELMKRGDVVEYQALVNGETQQDQEVKQNEQKAADQVQEAVKPLENDGLVQGLEGGTVVKSSLTTWWDTDKRKIRQQLKKAGFKTQDINRWIDDVESIAAMIAQDRDRLDYKASTVQTFLKDNAEYVKTLDSSTLCAKRRLYQGTFDAIQHALPNTVITSDMLIHLRNMMAERNYETPCGICYVESRRRNLGTFTERFIKNYEGDSTGYKPSMDDLTTMDGLEDLRTEHPEVYEAYRAAMAKTGSNNPKVVQPRTEYRGEILQLTPGQVQKIVEIGGLRVQSFSDFETPHLIDMMQAVLDMSEKKLTSQAYTKVPNFAAVFGGTGIKINLSLIADGTGLDENGNLVYSSYEGMDIKRALELRDQYPDDVGTILVGVSDQHILAAMASDGIDFIIPFHKSGWGKKQLEQLTAMRGYHDYTADQNERKIVGTNKNGKPKLKKVEENFHPVDYWDYKKSGKQNAEVYLRMCAEDGRIPKFARFLVNNGDGSYSLQPDGSTDGYWKLLGDFKMYNHKTGKGTPQRAVTPNFNMEEAERVLHDYEGGADTLPVAQDVVNDFVEEYKSEHPRKKYSLSAADRQRDAEYMQAVESADEQKQQEMVKEAAAAAGYDTPKLYHGTGAFGFTEFNLEKGEGLIFATTDRSVAETYSGKTERSHISESIKINADELSGKELLATAQKHLEKYENYHLMDELDKEQEADLARDSLRDYWRVAKEFVEDNKYAFSDDKKQVVDKLVRALYDVSAARTELELDDAWSRWDNGLWDLKWMDESIADELMKAVGTHGLYVYKNRLSDFLYEGDIYCDENAMYYTFDNQLIIELDASLHKGVYEMYGKTDKQLVIDCKGSNWNRIIAPEELHLSGEQKTRDIAAAAKAYGYESVLLKNLYDMGDFGYRAQSDIYIYLAQNQVKSADPITYDDQGNVIPLSERFNTESNDIRYSLDEEGARAGQEMWERQQEYTGGESQVLQRLTGDLWTAIAQRKQQQKAENYGQWKAHVAEMARTIKSETNSNVFTEKQLEDRLTAILEEHEKMPHATREEAENAINNTLNELQGLIQEALSDQLMDEHYKEVKSALKNGIYINPDQVKELGGAAELRDFRNALSGFCRVYTSEKAANAARAMHLDGAGWEELQSIDPDVFNPDTHWLERAQALRDFVDLHTDSTMRDDPMTRDYIRSQALATLSEYYIGSNETDATKRTRDALKKANNKVSSLERQLQNEMKAQAALADQLKAEKKASYEKLNQVQNEAFGDKTKLNQQLQEAQAQTKATSAELTQALKEQDRLRNELDAADNKAAYLENTVRLLKKQNKQNQEAAVKSDRSKRAIKARARQNIKRLEMKMRRMLEKPNNTTYVPQDMIRKLLDMVEAIQKADTRKAAQVTDKWLKAVRELRDDTNNLLKDAYDDGFVKQMEEVADIVKDRPLNKLYTDELEYVSNVMTQALHQIETARQMIGWKKNADALLESHSFVETINAHKPQPTGGVGKALNNLATEHLTPQRELDKLAGYRKDNAIYRQKEGLNEGQHVVNKTKMDQTRNFEKLITGKNAQNFKKWTGKKADVIDTGIKGSRHGTFKMTHDFLTTLYMHSMNQQNLDGMKNGLTVPDYVLWKEGKRKEAWDRAERMYVSAEDMQRLMDMVSDYDKQWAEAWKENQAYITPKLNDVAMQLNGWHRFSVENYFPIRRDGNYLATDFDSIMLDDRIANMGFTKMRKNAKNPMMLESMLDVVNRTINGTSLYVGMLIPVTNFNKVFNMSLPDYEDSPKAALRRVFGNKEMEYIERMMKDLQQAGIRADESIFDKVRSKAAPAALGANMTVVIKQAASYPTAAAVLGWKPLAQQLAKPRKFDENVVNKYTSAYWERSDANIQAMNANVQSGGIDRTSSVLNKPIGAMDRATVRMIWGACEYAVEAEQPGLKHGSEEYNQAVARKYEECLEMTQPEYGTMQRPHIMRSNNTLQKAMTMYKTQAFQNMNIVYDAVQDFRTQAKAYKENQTAENKAEVDRAKTKLARAVSSQIVSATVLAVMTAVGKALLHKPEPYQDDKGEVTAASAAYQMSKDAISSMAGMVTGGSELFDLITGIMEGKQPYDIDASAISMINDLYQSMYKLGNAATIIGDGSLSWDKKLEKGGKAVDNFLKSAGAMLGIPYNNMRNIGTSVYKYADDILSGRGLEGLTTGDVTLTTAARYMGEALQRGDKDAYVRLYNRLLKQGKTASQINSAMKSWMKTSDPRIQQAATAIDSGDIDTYNMLINQMTDAGYGMANVVTAIEAVRKAAAESSEEGGVRSEELNNVTMSYEDIIEAQENADASAYTYAQMNQLLDSGNTRAALQVQKALFKSKGTTAVKSALTSYWKPKYQEAYQNRNRTELTRITNLLKKMGYSDQSINKWKTIEGETTNTSSKKTGFGSGTFGSSFGKKSSSKKSGSRFGKRF